MTPPETQRTRHQDTSLSYVRLENICNDNDQLKHECSVVLSPIYSKYDNDISNDLDTEVKCDEPKTKQNHNETVIEVQMDTLERLKAMEIELNHLQEFRNTTLTLLEKLQPLTQFFETGIETDLLEASKAGKFFEFITTEIFHRQDSSKNAVVFNIPDNVPLKTVQNTLLKACRMSATNCTCTRLRKHKIKYTCPILFKFDNVNLARQFIASKSTLQQQTPYKTISIIKDKTVLERMYKNQPIPRTLNSQSQEETPKSVITVPTSAITATTNKIASENASLRDTSTVIQDETDNVYSPEVTSSYTLKEINDAQEYFASLIDLDSSFVHQSPKQPHKYHTDTNDTNKGTQNHSETEILNNNLASSLTVMKDDPYHNITNNDENIPNIYLQLFGYNLFRSDRKRGRGGGCLVYTSTNLNTEERNRQSKSFTKINWEVFAELLQSMNWDNFFTTNSPEEASKILSDNMHYCLDITAPVSKQRKNHQESKCVRMLSTKIQRLQAKSKQTSDFSLLIRTNDLVIKHQKMLTTYVLEEEKRALQSTCKASKLARLLKLRNPKSETAVTSLTLPDQTETQDASTIASTFNAMFTEAFCHETFPLPNIPVIGNIDNLKRITIDIQMVRLATQVIRPSCNPGPDDIPPIAIKLGGSDVALLLSNVFNISLNTGIFPELWKHSIVIFQNDMLLAFFPHNVHHLLKTEQKLPVDLNSLVIFTNS
ncbi:hypothetical protein B566_EDAN019079, partial [Ephemera danica]